MLLFLDSFSLPLPPRVHDCAVNFYNVETSRTIHNKISILMLFDEWMQKYKTDRKTYGINVCNSFQHPIKNHITFNPFKVIDKADLERDYWNGDSNGCFNILVKPEMQGVHFWCASGLNNLGSTSSLTHSFNKTLKEFKLIHKFSFQSYQHLTFSLFTK